MDETISNMFIKIAEDAMSPSAVVQDAARKIGNGMVPEDLMVLDSKFIPVDIDQTGNSEWHHLKTAWSYTCGCSAYIISIFFLPII